MNQKVIYASKGSRFSYKLEAIQCASFIEFCIIFLVCPDCQLAHQLTKTFKSLSVLTRVWPQKRCKNFLKKIEKYLTRQWNFN